MHIETELPREVESLNQLKALLAYAIDRNLAIAQAPAWLEEGRNLTELLPWMQSAAANAARRAARPQCNVGRPWMRLFLRDLRACLGAMDGALICELTFDGSQLVFNAPGYRVAAPARGPSAWAEPYVVSARALARLPQRLMSDPVEVGVWEGCLEVGRNWIADTKAAGAEASVGKAE